MTVTGMDLRPGSSAESGGGGFSQNNLNRSSHTRTHSHPLPLISCFSQICPDQPAQPVSSTPLTDALNLDFVNIPSSPGSIPPSAMEKYLVGNNTTLPSQEISDILVDLDLECSRNSKSSTSEVVKVLDNFNTLLEQIDDNMTPMTTSPPQKFVSPTNSSAGPSSASKIKSSVEAFADLLLRGENEDEDLLIVEVELPEGSSPADLENGGDDDIEGILDDQEEGEDDAINDEADDQLCSLQGDEEDLDLEGYESDRPMVRASMRKLRPIKVKLKPVPEHNGTESSSENSSDQLCVVVVIGGESSAQNTGEGVVTMESGVISEGVRGTSPARQGTSANCNTTGVLASSEDAVTSTPLLGTNSCSTTNTTGGVSSSSSSSSSSPSVSPESQQSALLPSTPSSTNNATTSSTATVSSSSSPTSPPPSGTVTSLSPPPPTARRRLGGTLGNVPTSRWPHRLSSVLALIGCTLGLNNVCRFGLLSVNYGANFVVQWVILSFVLGVPLLTFHMSLGQYLHRNCIGMWKISPIFQGIGVGLLFSQALVGLYSTVGVSWMLIYFRDSFITRGDQYRWGKCVREFRECDPYQSQNQTDFADTVPDYFSGVVLQRSSPDYPHSVYVPNSLKFTVAFNLAVVWMLIFVSLSKGLKSYGKVVHGFVLAPVAALFVLTFKMVGLVDNTSSLFGQTAWVDFFFNTQTWVVAAREVFFTWGLLGACVMQVTSHNRHAHPLKSDAVIVVLVTTVVLLLSAFIGNSCLSIISAATPSSATTLLQRYTYGPSSFESERTYKFLSVGGGSNKLEDASLFPLSSSNLHHNPLLMGVRILRMDGKAGSDPTASGYQVLRLATELFPTAMAVLSSTGLSPFWTVLFYFTLVLFGLAQQLAIWHTVIKGVIAIKYKMLKSWETTITFFVCAMGFALGLPLCTETGVFVTYFLDFTVGSGWWIMILYLLELVAVFIVRGAPYCGENIVTVLLTGPGRMAKFLAPLVSFIWNVIMPVALLVLSIASFKSGNIRELYDWNPNRGYIFWPSWTREVGSLIQLLPILAVPFVAIVQSCRYLTSGSSDIFERLQQLYRPSTRLRFGSANSESRRERSTTGRSEDPPPKYTPPPSYSTATGAKIARFLRNSIRRSMRRITTNPNGPSTSNSDPNLPPPPAYASVILEINSQSSQGTTSSSSSASSLPPPLYSEATAGTSRQGTKDITIISGFRTKVPLSHTLSSDFSRKERPSVRRISSEINSRDIARMLSLRSGADNNTGVDGGVIIDHQLPGTSTAPPYTFSHSSLEKIDYDLDFLNHLELGCDPDARPTFDLLSFNRSRNRNSNDSQLALISDGFLYDNSNGGGGSRSSSRVELDIDMRLGFQNPERHSEA